MPLLCQTMRSNLISKAGVTFVTTQIEERTRYSSPGHEPHWAEPANEVCSHNNSAKKNVNHAKGSRGNPPCSIPVNDVRALMIGPLPVEPEADQTRRRTSLVHARSCYTTEVDGSWNSTRKREERGGKGNITRMWTIGSSRALDLGIYDYEIPNIRELRIPRFRAFEISEIKEFWNFCFLNLESLTICVPQSFKFLNFDRYTMWSIRKVKLRSYEISKVWKCTTLFIYTKIEIL